MDDLKELIDHPECCWGYIDELRMALASACKERDEMKCVDYAEFGSDEPYDFAISDYGDSFKAYRQKPEEGTV